MGVFMEDIIKYGFLFQDLHFRSARKNICNTSTDIAKLPPESYYSCYFSVHCVVYCIMTKTKSIQKAGNRF